MVSSTAFLAFSCEEFDNGRSYLRADYAIECSDTEASGSYKRVELLAWLGILLYPVGRPQQVEGLSSLLRHECPKRLCYHHRAAL